MKNETMTREERSIARATARAEKKAARAAEREARKNYVPTEDDLRREEMKSRKAARATMIALTAAVVGGIAVTSGVCIYAAVKGGDCDAPTGPDADDGAEALGALGIASTAGIGWE